MLTGAFSALSPAFGLLPFGTFASSSRLAGEYEILNRSAMVIGSGLFFLFGLVPPLGDFLSEMPLSIGSACCSSPICKCSASGRPNDTRPSLRLENDLQAGASDSARHLHHECACGSILRIARLYPASPRSGLIVGIVVSVLGGDDGQLAARRGGKIDRGSGHPRLRGK
ncbi:hypothetical protein D3H35_03510 [Cohnella faecalis]|uniref:Uncharacterized protein n=1 Tax=Cohnella faecalis TaxID=2315694 RepID=A0A398CWH0_9BACL|nr:hypothetical protein D3H35_03510 [Cohnella faecalis]